MIIATKDALLAKNARKTQDLDVPELGLTLRLRELAPSAAVALAEKDGWEATKATLQAGIVDEHGAPLLTPGEVDTWVDSVGIGVLNRIGAAILKLSGDLGEKVSTGGAAGN